jgi:2-oxoglutarate ferredoxin oxidoreductase subunit beta
METYGFHTIHGRSPAIATGVKLANPDLDVWVVGGDGDMLSIGGNHTLHALRRNVDLQILLFNNEIYGLTKGQYSPTSQIGTQSPSSPYGSIDRPVSAAQFAIGAGGRFIARSADILQKHLPVVLKRAYENKGASFVEIFQNCIVYNDGVFKHFTEKGSQADMQIHVEHGKPLIFGAESNKGLRIKEGVMWLEVITIGEDGITEDDVLRHDETNRPLAMLLASMKPPAFPVALGVLYCDPAPTYDGAVHDQVNAIKSDKGDGDFDKLLRRGHTWEV